MRFLWRVGATCNTLNSSASVLAWGVFTYIRKHFHECGVDHSCPVVRLRMSGARENVVKVLAASVLPVPNSSGLFVLEQLGLIHLLQKRGNSEHSVGSCITCKRSIR